MTLYLVLFTNFSVVEEGDRHMKLGEDNILVFLK